MTDWNFITSHPCDCMLFFFFTTLCHESSLYFFYFFSCFFPSSFILSCVFKHLISNQSFGLYSPTVICLRAKISGFRVMSKHEVWERLACVLLSSAPFFFLPFFHRWSSSQMWSCPGQNEWPGVTSCIWPQGWICLSCVSLKGHTIKCKQSSDHAYLEDREMDCCVSACFLGIFWDGSKCKQGVITSYLS